MNITDIKVNLDGNFDKLEKIFELQCKLKEKYDVIERGKGLYVPELPLDINSCKNQEYLKSIVHRVVAELEEASECLRNKPWKQSEVLTDGDHLKEELSDALHFFVELCINFGISAEELFNLYFRKQEVNKWRQRTKY
jgi:NTP pyrophosphatase (non-canonical NTP hydrolase)